MSCLPDQFLALCTYDCGIPQWYWWVTNFCLINKNSLPFLVEEYCNQGNLTPPTFLMPPLLVTGGHFGSLSAVWSPNNDLWENRI